MAKRRQHGGGTGTRGPSAEVRKQATADMEEIGATGLDVSGGRVHEEFLQQLTGERALKTYREMSENDPVVGAMLYALEVLMGGVPMEVEPYGDEPGDKDSAEFVETLFEDMSQSRSQWFSEWMATPVYGYCPFEIVWKLRQGAKPGSPGESSRFNDGKIGIRKLAIRHPCTLVRWEMDEQGGMQAMIQRAGSALARIPVEKLLLFTVRARKGSPEGTSLLRNAYIPWYRKKHIEDIESIGIERDLAGLPHFEVPAQWLGSNATDGQTALLNEIKKIGRRLRNDDQACVITPLMLDTEGNPLFKFSLINTGGRRQFDTNSILQRLDTRIAIPILADVILLGHEKVGSYALSSSKTNLFAAGLGALLRGIEDVLNRHLVPRVLALNGMNPERPPAYRFGDIESVDLSELGGFIQQLAGAGMPLFPTESGELEREVLRVANLPISGAEGAASGQE